VNKLLWHGGDCDIPREIAVCPECDAQLHAQCMAWNYATGRPSDIDLHCVQEKFGDEDFGNAHYWRQSDWQPVRDKVDNWAGCDRSIA